MTIHEFRPTQKPTADRIQKLRLIRRLAVTMAAIAIAAVASVWLRARLNPQRLGEEAHNALQSGDLATAKARMTLMRYLRAPTDFDWSLQSQIALASNRPDEAMTALSHIPASAPIAPQAFLLAGRIERQRNRASAAEAKFRQALACDSGLIEAHKELIYILNMQLRRSEVDAEFKALSRLRPLSHQELFAWGLSHFSVFVLDSMKQLEAFIEADPDDRYIRLSLATALLNSTGMQNRLEETLEPLPLSDPLAAALRIELKFNQGRVEEAESLLNASGDHPRLARLRGRVASRRHDYKAAIRYDQDALTTEPYDRVSFTELGQMLVLVGDSSTAEKYLAKAKRLNDLYNLINGVRQADRENRSSDLTEFGRTCEAAGLIDEASGWYQSAIRHDPLDAEAQQALRRLRPRLRG